MSHKICFKLLGQLKNGCLAAGMLPIIIILFSIDSSGVNAHLYKSPSVEVFGRCRLLLPWLREPCWFFLQSGVEKLQARVAWIEPTTLDLRCIWPLSHCDPLWWFISFLGYQHIIQGILIFSLPEAAFLFKYSVWLFQERFELKKHLLPLGSLFCCC